MDKIISVLLDEKVYTKAKLFFSISIVIALSPGCFVFFLFSK